MKIKNRLIILLPMIIIALWLSVTMAATAKDKTKPVISDLTVTPSISNGVKPNVIKFKVSEPATISISIIAGKKVVKSYSATLRKAGFVSWGWVGSKSGGTYTVRISATDASKNTALKTSGIIIDKIKPIIVKHGFNSYPIKPGSENILNFSTNEPVIGQVTISSQFGVVYVGDSGNLYNKTGQIVWDGKDISGNYVAEGIYTYSLKLLDKAGNYQVTTKAFGVEGPPKVEIMPLTLPFEVNGTNNLNITYKISKTANVQIKIMKDTNVVKELFVGEVGAGTYSLPWDGKDTAGNLAAPGAYTLKITATDNKNNTTEALTNIDSTGVSLTAAKSDGKDLVENSLDKAVIKLTLAGDTFKSLLLAVNFQLNNAPQGLTISGVKRVSDTSAELTLSLQGDFDTDITNFSITAKETALTKGRAVTSGNMKITSVIESLIATKSDGNQLNLGERNLNGAVVRLSISGDTYKNTIASGDIEFNNAPGTQTEFNVNGVKRVDNNTIEVTLNFTGDFDTDITNFSIKVKGNVFTSGVDQQTGSIALTAVNELEATNPNGTALALTESNLNGAKVRLKLNGLTFNRLPAIGLKLKSSGNNFTAVTTRNVAFVGTANNTVDFELVYDRATNDLDVNIDDLQIYIQAAQLSNNRVETTLPISVIATDELQAVNADRTALNLNEKNLNGTVIRLNLVGGNAFNDKIGTGDFDLLNEPKGLTIASISRVSTTEVLLFLAYQTSNVGDSGNDTSTYDLENNIYNFQIQAKNTALANNLAENTKLYTITAVKEYLTVAKPDGTAAVLSENNIKDSILRITLTGETFKGTLTEGDFQLDNVPIGINIKSITRVNDNIVDIKLDFDIKQDFDINYPNFTVTAKESATVSNRSITSNAALINALVEGIVATKTDGNALSLNENNLKDVVIRLNLSGATFKDSTELSGKIQLTNTPPGVTLKSFNRVNDTTVDITLDYLGNDFDSPYGMVVTIDKLGINYWGSSFYEDLTTTIPITNLTEKVDATNIDGTFTPGGGGPIVLKRTSSADNPNNTVVRLVLSNDSFKPSANLTTANFQVLNGSGLSIGGINRISDTVVDITINGNFSSNVAGISIKVLASGINHNLTDLTTPNFTISAT